MAGPEVYGFAHIEKGIGKWAGEEGTEDKGTDDPAQRVAMGMDGSVKNKLPSGQLEPWGMGSFP